jgi:HAD superfamily hydrolase (TIGR01509 family)
VIQAVVFDLDGVLVDSEQLWDEARRDVAARHGGRWHDSATARMQGMSSPEWSAYMHDVLGVHLAPEQISELVADDLLRLYERGLPLLAGARSTVAQLAARWPLALASSANRVVIDEVLRLAGMAAHFAVVVSSEEVARGKPAPDVYQEAARRLGRGPERCAAVEDAANGIRSALAAGLRVVAIPNPHYPPPEEVLAQAHAVVGSLPELTAEVVQGLGRSDRVERRLDEQEVESFPASDPHSDWAGPPRAAGPQCS